MTSVIWESALHIYRDSDTKSGVMKMVTNIFKTTMHLPDRIQSICWIQFWAWLGQSSFNYVQ